MFSFGGFDSKWLLFMLPGMVFSILAQIQLKRKFGKYGRMKNAAGMSGRDTSRAMLDDHSLRNVKIQEIRGRLTDHYDPGKDVVNLSRPVHDPKTIAAMGVAAHETGHAYQDADGYFMMTVRGALVPFVNIGTSLSYIVVVTGLVLQLANLAKLGVILFGASTLFALVTLPVEFNATKRAKKQLNAMGLVQPDEADAIKDMLRWAAMTYVAAFTTSILQFVYFWRIVDKRTDEIKLRKERVMEAASEVDIPEAPPKRTGGGGPLFERKTPQNSQTGNSAGGTLIDRMFSGSQSAQSAGGGTFEKKPDQGESADT